MKTFALLAASICQYHKLNDTDLARVKEVESATAALQHIFLELGDCLPEPSLFKQWQNAIDGTIARVGAVLPRPTPEATIAARALSTVRMCGNRVLGGQSPIGSKGAWHEATRVAIQDFLLAAISAVVMDPSSPAEGDSSQSAR